MKILCKRTISLLLALVMLLGMVPAFALAADEQTEPETITMDFKQIAKDAAEQPWWDDLATVQTANGYDTKRVGNVVRGTAMSDTEREAYGQLCQWLSDTYGWTINGTGSYLDYASGGSRLYLCADDNVAWGASFNTYYRDYPLAFDVFVETAGEYDLSMVTSKVVKASQDFPKDGWDNTQGGTVDVLVNGELIYDEYNFEGTGTDLVKLGKVKLLSGKNTIVFNSSLNYAGLTTATPCWHFNLVSVTAKLRQSAGDAGGIDINFKDVAKAASEESFWNDLETVQTANGYDTKRVGNIVRGTAMTDAQRKAYGDLRVWLDETYGWTINESKSYFDYAGGGNRLYLCADDSVDWGVSLNTYYRNYCLAIDVDVPATGLYNMSMVTSKVIKGVQDFPVDGWDTTQGGTIDVIVNGNVVYDEYNFEGTGIENVELGAIFLEAGVNTIEFNSSKNYVGTTTATPCWHFNLRSLSLLPMEAEQVNEYALKTVKLPGAYVSVGTVITPETHSAASKDETVALARIDETGLLEIRGVSAGKTDLVVYAGDAELCTVAVEVLAVDASLMQTVKLDFKDFARQASGQSFWTRLPNVVNADTPFIGKVNNADSMTSDQIAAYNEMIQWGMETFGWTINEGVSGFGAYWKQLFLNGQDNVPWGMNMWTYYHGSSEPSRSKMAFTVNVAQSGWYGVDLSAFTMGSSWPGVSSTTDRSSGGDRIAVYVNGTEVFYDLPLGADSNAYVAIDRHLGAAYFEAGENVIAVDSVYSYNDTGVGGRSNTPLIDMTLEPLTGVQVQEYLSASVDLKKTYLSFNTNTSNVTVEPANDWIATATINANGVVTITGVTSGQTSIFVKDAGEVVCIIPVTVTGFEGELDTLKGSPAKLDFMAVMDRAVEQEWWNELSGEDGVKSVTTEDTAAMEWIEENTRWSLTEADGVTFASGSALYGVGVDGKAVLNVDIPAEGLYNVTVEYLAGGEAVDVSVNDETLYTGLDTAGEAARVKRSLGTVTMKKGENTIAFDGKVALRSVTFTPLGAWQAEIGSKRYIDLNATYLPFDVKVTPEAYTVSVVDEKIAEASFDTDGELVITGVSEGRTAMTVSNENGVACSLYVDVVAAGSLLELTYTIDDFKAQTLQVGQRAVGLIAGMTTKGTQLTEKQLYLEGSVYYLTGNSAVAKVDQATGDVICVGEGTTTVTAYALLGGVTGKAVVTVTVTDETDLASIDVTAPVDYVATGNSMQLTATGLKTSGAAANMANYPVVYTISEDQQAIATVSEDGRVTGHSVGTVTVTATAAVMKMPITDTIEIEVVENSELSGTDIKLQFDEARVLDVFDWTLERDGLKLVAEETANGGEGMFMDAMGIRHPSTKGEGLSFDFVVKKSGWYRTFMQGKQLTSAGGLCYCYVDDSYVGLMLGDAANSNDGAGGYMSTVYLEAGVHNVRVIAQESCQVMVGRIIFQPTQDPRAVQVDLQAGTQAMVVGQKTELSLELRDANGESFEALRLAEAPDHTNYYDITSSRPDVVAVSGSTLTAVGEGTAEIVFKGELVGETVTRALTITVTGGTIVSAELTAQVTTVKPDAEPIELTLTAYDLNGNALESLPEGVSVSYTSGSDAVQVDANGVVSFTGAEGTAIITATVNEDGKTVEATIWITATNGKTEPTLYTYEEREAAQENVLKYDWAWSMKETAVKKADYYVEHLDQIYDMWIPETFPRACQVGFKGDSNYRYCRYCGVDLVTNYHAYPWLVDPIENPWKITCPACMREFPSNDFGAYYESGLGEDGKFHEELADKSLLTNDLYPEMGEGWGVDNGWGYEAADGSVHTYIAYYLCCVFEGLYQSNYLTEIMNALRNAYLYTGDEKYGSAGAILTDRIADIYPDYDVYQYDWYSYAFVEAYSGRGKFIGLTWDAIIGKDLSRYVDTFWTAADNPDVVEYLQGKAHLKGMAPEDITPEYIRKNAEDGILLELFEAAKCGWIQGNFGMSEAAVAYAAHTLNRLPESQEMVDWVFRTEVFTGSGREYNVAGGDVLRVLVNDISRDGLGHEGSTTYNSLMEGNLLDVADALDGFDLVDGYDLWENQKFVNMYTGAMRMVTLGAMTPQIHEGGNPQQTNATPSVGYMTTAFTKSGDPEIARALYAANGNSTAGLHADIFTKDPEAGLRTDIQQAVNEYGKWDMSASDMLSGYGIAMLREGPATYLGKSNAHEFSTYWMGFGYSDISHAQLETLHIDVEAFGISLSSSMGYPALVASTDPERMQWVRNTISHNTVVVDDKGQSPTDEAGFPMHFADDGYAKVIDIQDDKAYEETDIYRRTLVAVDGGEGIHYAVDFFRVLGGSEHVYSFHGATDEDPVTEGLVLDHQPMGTYEGPEAPFGDGQEGGINFSNGYTWLDDVYRDDEPSNSFTVDWAIKDFNKRLTTTNGIHLKFTMHSEEPMTEVAFANGYPPQRTENINIDHLEYMLVRRSGEEGMDTLFTSVIEPYQHSSYIDYSELVDVVLSDGTEGINDRAAAMKVVLKSGRVDYIVYATNPDCTYEIDGKFVFQGFTGVVSYTDGQISYAWGNEAVQVADVVENALPAVTGTVTDFTKGITMDGYSITVTMDQPVEAQQLVDQFIYVQTDGVENGVYHIYGAEISGNTAVLDLKHQTLVREYIDNLDLDKGYKYNIAEGASYTIPLSCVYDAASYFSHAGSIMVTTGSKLNLTTGVSGIGVTYAAEGMPSGMKLNASNGTITWTPSKAQAGRYPITVKAVENGETVAELSFVIYAVAYTGSTYDPAVCTHSKAVTYEVDGMIETVCPACGTITKTAADEEEQITKFDIAGANMTLGSDLKVNIMVKASDLGDGEYTAKITHNGEETEAVLAKYNSSYYFVTAAVSAKQMADTLTVEIYDENGSAVSNVYETSVRDYAMRLLENEAMSEEVKTLVVDMLNYGAAAQQEFSYNTEDLANSLLTDAQKEMATASVTVTDKQVKGNNFYGSNLSLEDKILLNLYFRNVTDGMYAEITYRDYKGEAKLVTVSFSDFEQYTGSIYKIPVDEIVLADAYSLVTVTVYTADGTVHAAASDSVESYVARANSDLGEAIMKFASSAKAYLA